MTTPVKFTGFEYGLATPVISGGGLFNSVSGSPTISSAQKHSGNYSLRVYASGSAASAYVGWTISGSSPLVVTIHFYFVTLPDRTVNIWGGQGSSTSAVLRYNQTQNKFEAWVSGTGQYSSMTLGISVCFAKLVF